MKRTILSIAFLVVSGLWAEDAQISVQGQYLQILGQLTTLDAGTGIYTLEGLPLEGSLVDEVRRNQVVYEELAGTFDPLHDYLVKGLDKVEIAEIEQLIEKVAKRMAHKLRRPNSLVRYLEGKATAVQQQEIVQAIKAYLAGVKDKVAELKASKSEEVPSDLQDDKSEEITIAAGEALPADDIAVPPAPELPAPPDTDTLADSPELSEDVKIEETVTEEQPVVEDQPEITEQASEEESETEEVETEGNY